MDRITEMLEEIDLLPRYRVIDVGATIYNHGGASTVQEIAFALAHGHEYLAYLTNKGEDAAKVIQHMGFSFSTGTEYFVEMAKYRAFRLLWDRIEEQYRGEAEPKRMWIDASTSIWNYSAYDAHLNILRGTTSAMSAILGGADEMQVVPFDSVTGKVTDFGNRIARHVQNILRDESYLDKVADPSGGAYYIEELTIQLAEKAWELFQTVESKGGYLAALKEGFIQAEIAESAAAKTESFNNGETVLLGVNKYPNEKA